MRTTFAPILLLALAVTLLPALPASADTYGLGFAGTFNTFVFNDFSGSSDTEGRLAVGGNANLYGYSVGDKLTPGQYSENLVVGGDLTVTSGRVYYGSAVVGGSATIGHDNFADGGVYTNAAMPFSFASEQARLTGVSASLAGLSATGSADNAWGGLTLVGDGTSGLQVFNLSSTELASAWGLSLSNIADDATVIINVSGLTAEMTNMNMEGLAEYSDKVLFNFYEATELTLGGVAVWGSILAVNADVTADSGVIWGTTIASSWTGAMQQNHNPFTGDIPATPIPGSVWLLGSGMLGLVGLNRLRRQ